MPRSFIAPPLVHADGHDPELDIPVKTWGLARRAMPGWPGLLLAAAVLGSSLSGHAQTAPATLPSGAEPGREKPRPLMPQSKRAMAQIEVPQSPATAAPPGSGQARFVLKDVVIEGATAYSAEVLRGLYAKLLDQEISVAQVFEVANAIELRYRQDGFVTSRVLVPEQTVADGRFRIRVLEGHVAGVVFQGEAGPAGAALESLMAGLTALRPINLAELERRLLLANDLPGLQVQGSLEASPTAQGGSTLVVRTRRRERDLSATLDNRATPYMGGRQISAQASWFGLGPRADRLGLSLRSSLPTGRSTSVGVNYDAMVSPSGSTLSLNLSNSRSQPGLELAALDIHSQVNSLVGTWAQPLKRSREENLRSVVQLEWRDVRTDLGSAPFTHDRLQIVRLGLSYDRADAYDGITTARGMLHQGLSGQAAGSGEGARPSRANGRSDFTKFTLDLSRLQQLGARTHAWASLTAQYSQRPLLASEELALGGAHYGRAFDDGEITGDKGAALMVELRHHPEFMPNNAQLFGFADAGRIWAAPGGSVPARPKLASAGAGVRLSLPRGALATLEVAKPLHTDVRTQANRNARAFFSLSAPF
jgi:hemolysin activation/secretion protein